MKKNFTPLYTDVSGNKIGVQSYTFGEGEKSAYIQGGIHAGEITYFIFSRLHDFLLKNESKLNKKVKLAPVINPTGWNQRIYYYTAGKFDFHKGKDWNRSYPGSAKNLSARNSEKIYKLNEGYDISIDLHTARISKPYSYFSSNNVLNELKALNLEYNIFIGENPNYKGMFQQALAEENRKGLTIECGSHDDYNEEDILEVYNALIRLFVENNVLDNQTNSDNLINNNQKSVEQIDVLHSDFSGFINYHVNPRDKVSKGDHIATIYSSADLGKKTKVTTPYDGVIFEISRSHVIWVGDELFRIINNNNLKKLA